MAIMGESRLRQDHAAEHPGRAGQAHRAARCCWTARSCPPSARRSMSAFRRDHLGFVFQDFNLLDTFSLRDNIFLPLVLAGKPYREMERRLEPLARAAGHHRTSGQIPLRGLRRPEAAGGRGPGADHRAPAGPGRRAHRRAGLPGHGQPAAAVRASINARGPDHPDGHPLASRRPATPGRVLFIKDGEVFHQLYRGEGSDQDFYQRITRHPQRLLMTGGGSRA